MKTRFVQIVVLLCLLVLLVGGRVFAQSGNVASNSVTFPMLESAGGLKFSAFRPVTNCYPYTRIGGEGEFDEMMNYGTLISKRQVIPEILPAEQDTNGNWGLPTDGMQLSIRFHQPDFIQGQMVSAYIILRNLGDTPRQWWRNSLPDNGYRFMLTHGTNTVNWMRPPSHRSTEQYISGSMTEGDPYMYVAAPRTQGLTIVYLNRFFDLSQPGPYSLQVQIQVPTSDGKGKTNVLSGAATFVISSGGSLR